MNDREKRAAESCSRIEDDVAQCECEHLSHAVHNGVAVSHIEGAQRTVRPAKTIMGTFHLCDECILDGHMVEGAEWLRLRQEIEGERK